MRKIQTCDQRAGEHASHNPLQLVSLLLYCQCSFLTIQNYKTVVLLSIDYHVDYCVGQTKNVFAVYNISYIWPLIKTEVKTFTFRDFSVVPFLLSTSQPCSVIMSYLGAAMLKAMVSASVIKDWL
ncbi:hypothetical protein BsWGS_00598 [Bradybaena similaris]